MSKNEERERVIAVQRYLDGETPDIIYNSLRRSKSWFYKWVGRHKKDDPEWHRDISKRPHTNPLFTAKEVEEAIKLARLSLYNKGAFCGAQAIFSELEDMGVSPPSKRTINRILSKHELTHKRTGRYSPTGRTYPALPAQAPNERHQSDFVGPRYIKGPLRFYSLNTVDLATGRCAVQPVYSRAGQDLTDAFLSLWSRLGVPANLQVDNDASFYGSHLHPRGMGPLIRLCLQHDVELWFTPPSEPWRNGVVEKFNSLYQKGFLRKEELTRDNIKQASLAFEYKHNSVYRYSKLKGQTPLKTFEKMEKNIRFPETETCVDYPLSKPEKGRYHLIRFIRGDCKLDIFGEKFIVPPELQYEYIVATVDVKEQKLQLFLNQEKMEEHHYKLR